MVGDHDIQNGESVLIAVVNESTVVDAQSTQLMAAACASQLRHHVAPAWSRQLVPVSVYPNLAAVPVEVQVVSILDNADQAGALGYHDETPDGRPYSR